MKKASVLKISYILLTYLQNILFIGINFLFNYLVAARKLHFLRYARLKIRHLRLVKSSFSVFESLENEAFLSATVKNTEFSFRD